MKASPPPPPPLAHFLEFIIFLNNDMAAKRYLEARKTFYLQR
jgi:hypothetical protein